VFREIKKIDFRIHPTRQQLNLNRYPNDKSLIQFSKKSQFRTRHTDGQNWAGYVLSVNLQIAHVFLQLQFQL
jgi:hypothetical protein